MVDHLADVSVEHHLGAVLVRLTGEIDMSNARSVEERLEAELTEAPAVVADLGGLGYLDSAGLAVLSRLARRLSDAGIPCRLVVPDDAVVRRTVLVAGLDAVLPLHRTVPEAIAGLRLDDPPLPAGGQGGLAGRASVAGE